MQTNDPSDSAGSSPSSPSSSSQPSSGTANTPNTSASTASTDPNDKPIVKTDLAPGDTQAIPDHLAGAFPSGAIVTKHESGELVANLPAPGGGYTRVVVPKGQSIDHLADKVKGSTQPTP